MCGWQVKLCDPLVTHGSYLSALEITHYKAPYQFIFFLFLFSFCSSVIEKHRSLKYVGGAYLVTRRWRACRTTAAATWDTTVLGWRACDVLRCRHASPAPAAAAQPLTAASGRAPTATRPGSTPVHSCLRWSSRCPVIAISTQLYCDILAAEQLNSWTAEQLNSWNARYSSVA